MLRTVVECPLCCEIGVESGAGDEEPAVETGEDWMGARGDVLWDEDVDGDFLAIDDFVACCCYSKF